MTAPEPAPGWSAPNRDRDGTVYAEHPSGEWVSIAPDGTLTVGNTAGRYLALTAAAALAVAACRARWETGR